MTLDLAHLTFVVLFYLCVGFFTSFGFLKQSLVGRNFFFYHGVGTSVFVFLIYLAMGRTVLAPSVVIWLIPFIFFSLVFSLSVGKYKKLVAGSFFLGLICAFGAILLDIVESAPSVMHTPILFNSILSTLLLGFTMAAMLLGHWYLNQPGLSISELKRITLLLFILIGVRFLFATFGVVQLLAFRSEIEIYRYLSTNPGVFVLMRWFWGILGPLALTYFIWGTVKISSTQSATGILYVAVVFVLIGEILSQYLAFYHGITF